MTEQAFTNTTALPSAIYDRSIGSVRMTELEMRVAELGAGLKLLSGMLGLTVALLPDVDRAVVLQALAALQTESNPGANTDESRVAARSESEAGKALTVMIRNFAAEVAAVRVSPSDDVQG